MPLNFTDVAPVRFVPVTCTDVPTGPDAGVNELIDGAETTVNDDPLVAVPPAVVTDTGPDEAPSGTLTTTYVALLLYPFPRALVPLKATPVTPPRLVPLIVTLVPTVPDDGETDVMTGGAIVKFAVLVAVPPGVVTEIGPAEVSNQTVAVISVPETTEKYGVLTPLNLTAVVPRKPRPLIVTRLKVPAAVGENEEIAGGPEKIAVLITVPPGVVTEIGPASGRSGNTAVI